MFWNTEGLCPDLGCLASARALCAVLAAVEPASELQRELRGFPRSGGRKQQLVCSCFIYMFEPLR